MKFLGHLCLLVFCYVVASSVWAHVGEENLADSNLTLEAMNLLKRSTQRLVLGKALGPAQTKMALLDLQKDITLLKAQGLEFHEMISAICPEGVEKEIDLELQKKESSRNGTEILGIVLQKLPPSELSTAQAVATTALILGYEGLEFQM